MAFRFLQRTTAIAALLSATLAQTTNIIPQDLSAGFNNEEVQVSFSNNAVTGFASGTTFEKDAVSSEPTFALGDSNGISPSTLYTLIMVDTTCPTARTLHYARSNFKFAFAGGTNIETESPPLLDYKAPGALQEQGDGRQYVFLMYTNPQRREINDLQLPAEGAAFDAQKFQSDNRLNDPVAGVGMVVKLGGTAECDAGGANPVPSGSPSAAPVTSSAGASTAAGTSAAPTQTASSASAPASPSVPSVSSGGEDGQAAPPTSATETQTPASSSSVLQTDETEPTTAAPIATLSSVRATVTGNPTTSSGPSEQTANAAAAAVGSQGAFVAQVLVVAGVLVW
jgi:hypothetical protein